MNYIENDMYYITQDISDKWGKNIIILAKTYEGIGDIDSLSNLLKEAKLGCTHKDVIFDLTLSNGFTASNRYLLMGYNNNTYELELTKSKTIQESIKDNLSKENFNEDFIEYLKTKTCNYLRKNLNLLSNSIIPNAQKYIIENLNDII